MVKVIDKELEKLEMWFKVNRLSLNVLKSNYMVFGKKNENIPEIKLNGITLDKVALTKFVGVLIDYQLS